MKNIILGLFFIISMTTYTSAQEWQSDITTAKSIAKEKGYPILLVFKGSDWCAPCIKLDRQVFDTETFKIYAKDHMVLLEADFPKRKKNALAKEQQEKNDALAARYNKRGIFPFVVILDAEGTVLGETGYFKASPSEYILHLEEKITRD